MSVVQPAHAKLHISPRQQTCGSMHSAGLQTADQQRSPPVVTPRPLHRCAVLQEAFVKELEVRGGMTLPAAVANAQAARLPLMRCCGAAQAAAAVQEAAEQQEAAVE